MQVSEKNPTGDFASSWDQYVERTAGGTFCHLSAWLRVVYSTWGHEPHYLAAIRGADIIGVLPLFHVRSRIFGSMLVSTPNAMYGGPLADDPAVREALIADAKRLATALAVDYLELRSHDEMDERDAALLRKDLYVQFDMPLVRDEDAMLRRFPSDLRRMIRLGSKHGLTSEVGREELIDEFYDVYAWSMRNLGTPVFPKRLMTHCLREFPASNILRIRKDGRTAGAVLSFYFGDTVYPYYAGAYREFYSSGVNNFMYWELMREAARNGYSRFDFGRSKVGTGAYAFKQGWRMRERPLPYTFFLGRRTEMPNLTPTNPKFRLLIRTWQRLPLGVTKILGPVIVRNIP